MKSAETETGEMREFMFVVRRALLLVVRWIEKEYGWQESRPQRRRTD
jgi:hypothetical protein